jgi:SnoaL-like domain
MIAQNAERIRRGYEAFSRGDVPAVFEILGKDITWHVPGSRPLSGGYKGHDEVGAFFATTMELSGGRSRSASRTSSPSRTRWSCCARSRPNAMASHVHPLRFISGEWPATRPWTSASSRATSKPRTNSGALNGQARSNPTTPRAYPGDAKPVVPCAVSAELTS